MNEGLVILGTFKYKDILSAVEAIVDSMGKSAFIIREIRDEKEDEMIILGFKKSALGKWVSGGIWHAIANEPDLAAVVEIEQKDDKQKITVAIVDAATIQHSVMFIPVTTKIVQGMAQYREFLNYFEEEIVYIDQSAIIERI